MSIRKHDSLVRLLTLTGKHDWLNEEPELSNSAFPTNYLLRNPRTSVLPAAADGSDAGDLEFDFLNLVSLQE